MDNENYEYAVEIYYGVHGILDRTDFDDANVAYHYYRQLNDMYYDDDFVVVRLIEPD